MQQVKAYRYKCVSFPSSSSPTLSLIYRTQALDFVYQEWLERLPDTVCEALRVYIERFVRTSAVGGSSSSEESRIDTGIFASASCVFVDVLC